VKRIMNDFEVEMSEKNQILVPKELRDKYKVIPGDILKMQFVGRYKKQCEYEEFN